MKKHKLAFIDIESTGLDPERHEIIQIGVVVATQEWVDGKPSFQVVEEFEIKVKPERIEDADKSALKINGYNEADWTEASTLPEAMKIFSDKTADTIMVAHNVVFDYCFLNKAFYITGEDNRMHYHKLDTISIAFAKLYLNEDVDRFSLQYICDHFGIVNEKAHTALSDSRATFELYQKLMNL